MTMGGALYSLPAILLIRRTWGVLSWRTAWGVLKVYRREIARFLAYNDLNALLGMIPKQLDLVLLGYFRNPAEVGYYKLSKQVAGAVGYLGGSLQGVTYPRLAQLGGPQRYEELYRTVKAYAFRIGMPLGGVVLLTLPLVPMSVGRLLGEDYLPAALSAQILLAGSAVWLAFFWLRPLFLTFGEVRVWSINAALVSIISLIGFFIAVPRWGYVGMAWVSLIAAGLLGHLCALGYLLVRVMPSYAPSKIVE